MASVEDRIKAVEEELSKTKRHKGTEHHIGLLLAKLARLRREREFRSSKKGGGSGFDIKKAGDATVVMVGFPSVGKSTLLSKLTRAKSKVADYEFTTLEVIPGIMEHEGAKIQVLDIPGIIGGAGAGKGRGKEVISVSRKADLILILLDAKRPEHYETIVRELHEANIRLDEAPPEITLKKGIRGGVHITTSKKLTRLNRKSIIEILNEFGMHNGTITFREDAGPERLVDALAGNRIYIPSVVAVNKVDTVGGKLPAGFPQGALAISAGKGEGIDALKGKIYEKLGLIKVYTKPRMGEIKYDEPMVLHLGDTVEGACRKLPRDFLREFRYALVWGKSVKFPGQRVGLEHVLRDGDILSIVKW